MRASSVPTLYACCLTKRSCHFLFVARVGLCCWFCDFVFGTARRSRKWDHESAFLLFFTSGACFFYFFCLSAGLRYLRLTRLPRHNRGPVPGGNRSAASCLCTVLRRAYTTTRRDRLLLSGACGPKNRTARRSQFWDRVRFIFWSLLYQGCRSATFWFQWSFVAYGGWKGN